jgi:hypothetical protein
MKSFPLADHGDKAVPVSNRFLSGGSLPDILVGCTIQRRPSGIDFYGWRFSTFRAILRRFHWIGSLVLVLSVSETALDELVIRHPI